MNNFYKRHKAYEFFYLRYLKDRKMEVNYMFTVGKKITSRLLYTSDYQLFRIKHRNHVGDHYNCYVKHCNAKVIVSENKCFYKEMSSNHTHGNQKSKYETFKVEANLKIKCSIGKKRAKSLYNDECFKHQDIASDIQFEKRRRHYNRLQSEGIPPNPKTMDEMQSYFANEKVLEAFQETKHTQPTLFYWKTVNLKAFGYTVFVSLSILNHLDEIQRYRIDGTFKEVPKGPFMQLLIISVDTGKHVSMKECLDKFNFLNYCRLIISVVSMFLHIDDEENESSLHAFIWNIR